MSTAIEIAVCREAGNWAQALPDVDDVVRRAAGAAWYGCAGPATAPSGAEVSIALADDAMVARLNHEYRGKDGPTNVLSFPSGDPGAPGRPRLVGDIVLALETIQREARVSELGVAEHVSHLVVHGLLHLLGYDHETDAEAVAMESLEIAILADMGIGDPYGRSEQPARCDVSNHV